MLGLRTIRNPYLSTLAMALVLLPLFWVPGHSHSIGVSRAHCSACLLALFSTATMSAGAIAILLMRDWREQLEFSTRVLVASNPSTRGRAPPSSSGR